MKNNIAKMVKKLNEILDRQKKSIFPESVKYHKYGQDRLLRLVGQNEGIMAKDLAALMGVKPPTVTEKLNLLEDQGLVRRERNNKDRRRVYIFLTPEGRRVNEQRVEGERMFQELVDSCLTQEEQIFFCEMCDRMTIAVNKMKNDEKYSNEGIIDFYQKQTRTDENRKQEQNV